MNFKVIKNKYQPKATIPDYHLVGVWVKHDSFCLDMGVVNATVKVKFRSDGIAEYSYCDDSVMNNDITVGYYTYAIDGNRLILLFDFEDNVNCFEIADNRLILTDDRYNFREEFFLKSIS